jgi:hypothetical protein
LRRSLAWSAVCAAAAAALSLAPAWNGYPVAGYLAALAAIAWPDAA